MLQEMKRTLADGQERACEKTLGKKILGEEDPLAAAKRGVIEELGALLQAPPDHPGVPCHLDVKFVARESFRIFDFHTNEDLPYYDGTERRQESTWRFEGTVGLDSEVDSTWKLYAIV